MFCVERQRPHLRRTACITLLAWLLALTAGVANACLLSNPVRTVGVAVDQAAAAVGQVVQTPHDDHSKHDPGAGKGHDGRANCEKFCADESSTVAKDGAKPLDFALLAVVEWGLQPRFDDITAVRVTHRLAEPPARPGPSLVIRLLRLTT